MVVWWNPKFPYKHHLTWFDIKPKRVWTWIQTKPSSISKVLLPFTGWSNVDYTLVATVKTRGVTTWNIDTLFLMLRWARCGFHKKRVRICGVELVFLHLMGYEGHVVHSSASGPWNVDALWSTVGATRGGGGEPELNKILFKNRPMSRIQNPRQPLC
jgi:hypothetical protein